MKKGINQWSFPADWSIKRCMEVAKDAGFEGIELALAETGEVSLESKEEDVQQICQQAEATGLELKSLAVGLMWEYPLTSNDPRVQEKGKAIVVKALDVARWLGADTVLVVPGVVQAPFAEGDRVPYDVVYDRALNAIKELAPEAEKRRVHIGLENVWNKFLLSPLEMRQFIDSIGSQFVGAYFDVGNVVIHGFPEDWIRILGNRIKKVHFKDYRAAVGTLAGFVNLLEGDVNWPAVVQALQEVGYDGYAYAEMSPYRYFSEAIIYDTARAMDRILASGGGN